MAGVNRSVVIDGERFGVSDHAVERYQQRIRPTLTVAQADVELMRVLAVAGRVVPRPGWLADKLAQDARAFVTIGDDVCLPVVHSAMVTCVARGSIGDEIRERRAARRKVRSSTRARIRTERNAKVGETRSGPRRRVA